MLDEKGDLTLESVIKIVSLINNYKPYLVVSFPNIFYRISELIYKHSLKLTYYPKCMDLSADFLFTCQYNFIKSIFKNCDIRLSYGTIEFGQIAQQIPNKMFDYIVFDDICYVENHKNNLVITNFLFTTQPIIRYLTDDCGKVEYNDNKIIIKNLIGKNKFNDISNLNYVNIDNLINNFENLNIIINFRINLDTNIIYIIVIDETFNNQITKYFNTIYNKDTNKFQIKIEVCNKIKCSTIDKYNRKNTPIINEFNFIK